MIKSELTITLCTFVILCIGSIFVYSCLFTDLYIVPKWLFSILVTLGMGLYCSIRLLLNKSIKINTSLAGISIVIICFALAVYGILQYFDLFSSHSEHKITGSYDNPAGFASSLCTGLPFVGFLLLQHKHKYIRYAGWGIAVTIVIAVVLSQSRAGIISIAAVTVILLYQRLRRKRMLKYLLLAGMFLLLIACYWMKKDSADGRLLIWQCGIQMAKDAPWIGHGIGSFEAHYMDYQAEYFRSHEHSRFAMLADNVKQPFNEYLKVLLNFGVIGLIVLLTLTGILIYCYKKNPSAEKKIAIYVLTSIGIFSLFSYPFTYPFIWIVSFFSIFMITHEFLKRYLHATGWAKNILCISLLICSLVGINKLVKRVEAEANWNTVAMSSILRLNDKMLLRYAELEDELGDNPYFLYNYAAILFEKQQYKKSLQIALKCRRYWADYDLELIVGENYQRLKQPDLAEKYYHNTAKMCPSRFLPLYKLFYLYKENREVQKAINVAKTIINKPMKIKTPTIQRMKKEMEREVTKTPT